jgi:hypothetical protein
MNRYFFEDCQNHEAAFWKGIKMKQTYTVPVKLPEDLMRKLLIVCKSEGRTPNNQFLFMLRNNIQYYERTKGKISPAAMKEQDITPYLDAQDEE